MLLSMWEGIGVGVRAQTVKESLLKRPSRVMVNGDVESIPHHSFPQWCIQLRLHIALPLDR